MLDFFRNFADRCHRAKEEALLFVRMEQRGVPSQGGPIGVMLAEHKALAAAFDRVEAEEMGAGVHERYHALAHELVEWCPRIARQV